MEHLLGPRGDTTDIDSLPVEILDIIFEYAAAVEGLHPDFDTPAPELAGGSGDHMEFQNLFPYNISAVCKSWRSVILYRPLYWKQVVIDLAQDPAPFLPVIAKFHAAHDTKAIVVFSSNKDIKREDEKRWARLVFKQVKSIISLCSAITFHLVYQSSLPSVAEVLTPYIPLLKVVRLTCDVHDCDPEYPDYEVESDKYETESDTSSLHTSEVTISDMDPDDHPPSNNAAMADDEQSGSESDAAPAGDVDDNAMGHSQGSGDGSGVQAEQVHDVSEENDIIENEDGEDVNMEEEEGEDGNGDGDGDDEGEDDEGDDGDDEDDDEDDEDEDDGGDDASSDVPQSERSLASEYLAITELTITGVGLNQMYELGDDWLHTSFQAGRRDITISIIHFKVGPYGCNIYRRTGPIISMSQFTIFLCSLRYKLVFTDFSVDSSKKDTNLDRFPGYDGLASDVILFPQLTFCNCTPEFISAFFHKFWTYDFRYAIHCPAISFEDCVMPRMPGSAVALPSESDVYRTRIYNFELHLLNIPFTPDFSGQFNESVYNAFRAFPAAIVKLQDCHGLNHHCIMQLTLPCGNDEPKLQVLQMFNCSGFTSATIRDLVQHYRFLSAGPDLKIAPLRAVRIGGNGPLLDEEDMMWLQERDNVGPTKVTWVVNDPPFNPFGPPVQVNWRIVAQR